VQHLGDLVLDDVPARGLNLFLKPHLLLEEHVQFKALRVGHLLKDLVQVLVELVQLLEGALG